MCSQGAQRAELTADQRQLGLHQPQVLINVIRHLLQLIGQGFFLIALHWHRQLGAQALGNQVDAVSNTLPRAFIFKNARVLHRRKAFQPMPDNNVRWLRRVYGS